MKFFSLGKLEETLREGSGFTKKLDRMISNIPDEGCKKIDGSVYLVKEKHAREFEELLLNFDGPNFNWQKFKLKK